MIQPLHADLLAGAFAHGLFDKVAGLVGEERIDPDEAVVLRLLAELRLAVDGPAHKPRRVLHGDDASRDNLTGKRVSLADFLDIRNDALIERFDRRAHPVGLLRIRAELVGVTESGVLRSNFAPHVPAAAGLELGVVRCRHVLAAHRGVLHTAAVCDEHQIVFRQIDAVFPAVVNHLNALCDLLSIAAVKQNIRHLCIEMELHAVAFQILDHRQNHRLILIVLGKAQRLEIGKPSDMVDIALDIELHLERAVPVFKGEHRAPVEPEVRIQNLVVKEVGDLLVLQLLVRREEQLHDLHRALVGDVELAVGVRVLPAVHSRTAQRIVGVLLVEPVILVENAHAFGLDRRNRVEQVPHDLEVVVHLAPAAHDIAEIFKFVSVARAAGKISLFQNMHPFALHLRVTHQIAGGGQRGKTAADNICRFLVDALGLFGSCKRFIVAAGIIHKITSVQNQSQYRKHSHGVFSVSHIAPRFYVSLSMV